MNPRHRLPLGSRIEGRHEGVAVEFGQSEVECKIAVRRGGEDLLQGLIGWTYIPGTAYFESVNFSQGVKTNSRYTET